MLLKNLMEDKQLNLNQPLLSVRRISSTIASGKDDKRNTDNSLHTVPRPPPYKSELKSGPVRNPGAVPFRWEQSPGRPKDATKQQTHKNERPPSAPRLPPGRTSKQNLQDSEKASSHPNANQSQARNVHHDLQKIPSSDDNMKKIESCDNSKDPADEKENSDSGDGDEVYIDALDTLSRTESFFLNCSVSGVSGLDDRDVRRPIGAFSTDPQTKDFMMGRFLPAAKAMASETPQYAPRKQQVARKQSLVQERPQQPKKVVNGDKRPPLRYGPSFAHRYYQSHDYREEECDDDYDDHGSLPSRVCGLLPRSFCLLNPLPGMSVRTRISMSPVSRTHDRSSSGGSCSETENERSASDVSEQKLVGVRSMELYEDKNDVKNKSNKTTYKSSSYEPDGSFLYNNLQVSGIAAHGNKLPHSRQQKVVLEIPREENDVQINGFSLSKEGYKTFQDLLVEKGSTGEMDIGSPVVEKTLYVDTIQKESPGTKSCSTDVKDTFTIKEMEHEILVKVKEENVSLDSSPMGTDKLNILDNGASQPDLEIPVDFSSPSSADKLDKEMEIKPIRASEQDQDAYRYSITLVVPDKESDEDSWKPPSNGENKVSSHGIHSRFPIPPPLPKSPSDSWLWRTLPSISTKNSALRAYLGTGGNPRSQASNTRIADSKWETIVKTTKPQHQHLRYSEELTTLTPIPETQ